MFKFFRSFRQRLFQQGKLKGYTGYAIGEILLIVVGILIALQINNWNEGRSDRANLRAYLERLRAEVVIDLDQKEKTMRRLEQSDEQGLELMRFIIGEVGEPDRVQLSEALIDAGKYTILSVSKDGYNNLVTRGNVELIENARLLERLAWVHNNEGWDQQWHDNAMVGVYDDYTRYLPTVLPPLMFRHGAQAGFSGMFSDEFNATTRPLDSFFVEWDELKNDREFRIRLDAVLQARVLQRMQYNRLENQLTNVLKLIDEELERL